MIEIIMHRHASSRAQSCHLNGNVFRYIYIATFVGVYYTKAATTTGVTSPLKV